MRHQRKTVKLRRTQGHRDALISNLAVSLIEHGRIKTTIAKAKAVRPFVEKLVTKAKAGSLHARRMALADLRHNEDAVSKLFTEIGPLNAERKGGYTRIVKLGQRRSDASEMAFIEWVDMPATAAPAPKEEKAKAAEAKPKRTTRKKAAPAEAEAKS
jgi:large subunit ribosomal protein L17